MPQVSSQLGKPGKNTSSIKMTQMDHRHNDDSECCNDGLCDVAGWLAI